MLDFSGTTRFELRSQQSPWDASGGDLREAAPPRDYSCDVLVIGGGISGSLIAEHLSARGRDVVVIDHGRPGFGSTAASTAMLQWEIDAPLMELADRLGFERAATIYQKSFASVGSLRELALGLGIGCGMAERPTLYLAAREVGVRELIREADVRQRAGLPGEYIDHRTLHAAFGFNRQGAIASPGSAEADPLRLANGLLRVSMTRGTKVHGGNAVAFNAGLNSVSALLDDGAVIEAQNVVLASGYALPDFLRTDIHSVASSWAICTKPQPPGSLWPQKALVWEASERYLYARTTADGAIIIGGEDEEIVDPQKRNDLIEAKSGILQDKLADLWPGVLLDIDYQWAGLFGETQDGLPLIGRVPGMPRVLAAYGYGGNGITFSFMASRMIAALMEGREERWFDSFALDREI